MSENESAKKKFLDGLSMFAAVITVITYLVLVINAQWDFLSGVPTIYNILVVIKNFAPLVVVALVGLEWVSGRSLLVRIIYYAAVALIVISMFFPGTWQQLVGFIEQ